MDAGIPEYVLDYARSLELPDPSGQLKLWLQDGESANRRRRFRFAARAPYYLLACAAEDETVCLNAGYVLERAAMLLGAHGVAAKVLLRVPEGLEELPGGRGAGLRDGSLRRRSAGARRTAGGTSVHLPGGR